MKKIIINYFLLSLIFLSFGCKTIKFTNAYKSHFTDIQLNGHRVENQNGIIIHNDYRTLPKGIFSSLSGEFRIAGLTDHLIVIQDTLGKIKYSSKIFTGKKLPDDIKKPSKLTTGEYLRVLHSKIYKATINEKREQGFIENSIPGYMDLVAYMEPLDYDLIIQTQYAQSWISWLKEYNSNLVDLDEKQTLNKKLNADINNSNNIIKHLISEKNNIKKTIINVNARARAYKQEYERLRRQKLEAVIDYKSPTNLFASYDYEKDPLKPYYDNNLVDITNYDWQINNGVSNKTLHTSTVDAYEKANKMFKNPEKYFDTEFANKVKGLDTPEIFSASRTIIHQATITSNPSAASWLNSNHAMGLSVDMSFAGRNYNVRSENPTEAQKANYDVFKKVMEEAGFVNTEPYSDWRERNHFTVEEYSLKKDGNVIHDPFGARKERVYNEKAKFFEGFADTADFQGEKLEEKIKDVAGDNSELLKKLGNIEEEIDKKRKEIDEELKKLEKSRIDMKKWEKARNKERDRIARERRRDDRGPCLAKDMDLNAVEFKMMPITNSIKHWDCGPGDGSGRCL